MFSIGGVHAAILYKHILAATGNLGTYHHTSVTVLHLAVADDDVLAGDVPLAAVYITATLDGNTVVACMEKAILYQYTVAGFGVAAVAVGTFVPYLHTSDSHVVAQQWVNDPER